jgi:hypothetical protein
VLLAGLVEDAHDHIEVSGRGVDEVELQGGPASPIANLGTRHLETRLHLLVPRCYCAAVTRPAPTLDVHTASWPPARWDEIDAIRSEANPSAWGDKQRPRITVETIDWNQYALTPRWLDEDSSEAVAALDPSIFDNDGAQEWRRLVGGATARSELVLAVSMIGSDAEPRGSKGAVRVRLVRRSPGDQVACGARPARGSSIRLAVARGCNR